MEIFLFLAADFTEKKCINYCVRNRVGRGARDERLENWLLRSSGDQEIRVQDIRNQDIRITVN